MDDTLVDIRLPCDPESVILARQAASEAMAHEDRRELVNDVVLVVSELVANAVSFTTGDCGLKVSRLGQRILVEVDDGDDVNPARRAETDRTPGHGLGVVQSIADRWGIERLDVGKCVWAEVSDPSISSQDDDHGDDDHHGDDEHDGNQPPVSADRA